ncbi:MAG: SGNH/GDSL hydrolase family protein [Anaerolineae bacterium]|nr:SGNH/GDSL hydrolase family protein [Anaerolineae bacterium]
MRLDRSNRPFHTLVTLGDSITAGGTATRRDLCWASLLTNQIGAAQQAPLRLVNSGLGGDVISPRSVGGPVSHSHGYPTALERCEKHVIAYHPDLVIVAYGVNDIDYGTPLHIFLDDLETLITTISDRTGALIVLLDAYFTNWTWPDMPPFLAHGRREVALGYNRAIEELSWRLDCLYASVWAAMGEAPWVVDTDGVHPNNLGHQLIANRVFEVLAQNCSVLARKAQADRETFVQWRDESAMKEGFGPWPADDR